MFKKIRNLLSMPKKFMRFIDDFNGFKNEFYMVHGERGKEIQGFQEEFRSFKSDFYGAHIHRKEELQRIYKVADDTYWVAKCGTDHGVMEMQNNFYLMYKELNLCPPENTAITLQTEYKVAVDSNDHKYPDSTLEGFLGCTSFVKECERFFTEIRFLDVGCGGGGLVFDFAKHGHVAIGLEGSDHNKRMSTLPGALIPNNFFTADATKEFKFENNNQLQKFNIITMWDVLEHIPEDGIAGLFKNIHNHLDDDGYFIGTISFMEYFDPITGVVFHITLKPKQWWWDKFAEHGFRVLHDNEHDFYLPAFYRGVGRRFQDTHTNYLKNENDGMFFVVQKQK